ncbi:reverse transcriptase domain-containing protein [Tanacetum coccineum]
MVKGHKLTRKCTIVTCSNYKCIGHNKRGCKGIGSSGGQMFDMPTREPVGSETMASQSVASQHVASQTRSRGPVASELVASEPVASQTVRSEIMASQSVASQPVAIQTRSRGPIKEAASEGTIDWNGSDLFQVKGPYQDQCVVNLNQKTCSCRKWEILGILCKHAITAIHDMADNGIDVGTPEDWVHESYKLQTWMNVYAHKINPTNGRDIWSKFECPTTLLPPKKASQTGRPPKSRKKSKGEIAMVKGHKLTRKGTTVACSNCKGISHNKRGCKGIGSSGGQMFDVPTREPVGSETMASQSVASQHVASQTRSRGPVASELVASQTGARKQVARKNLCHENLFKT